MERIKLPRCSYEELVKIITAYGLLNRPCSLDDIAQTSGIGKTNVSANNAFLSSIEIIDGGNKKSISPKGLILSKALEHNMEGEICSSWRKIVNENDFMIKMVQAIKIRKGMDNQQLENHIAFSSGEPKTGYVMTGAKCVVDILAASNLIIREGDKLFYKSEDGLKGATVIESSEKEKNETTELKKDITIKSENEIITLNKGGVKLNIDLIISAKPDELDGLGEKIKAIIDELNGE